MPSLADFFTYAPFCQSSHRAWPGPEVIKLFSYSTQLSMKFFLLKNVKMPTIVGILTFMSRKNSILHLSEPDKSWISWYFYTYEHLKFHAQLSWAEKKFYNLGPILQDFRIVKLGQVENPRWSSLLKIAKNNKISGFSRTAWYLWLEFAWNISGTSVKQKTA